MTFSRSEQQGELQPVRRRRAESVQQLISLSKHSAAFTTGSSGQERPVEMKTKTKLCGKKSSSSSSSSPPSPSSPSLLLHQVTVMMQQKRRSAVRVRVRVCCADVTASWRRQRSRD